MVGFRTKVLEKIDKLKKEDPHFFPRLREHVAGFKTKKFSAEQHLIVFDALTTYPRLCEAKKAIAEQGLACSDGFIDKVLMKTARFIGHYEYSHPLAKSAYLSSRVMQKIEKIINKELKAYGLITRGGIDRWISVSRADGKRFPDRREITLPEN